MVVAKSVNLNLYPSMGRNWALFSFVVATAASAKRRLYVLSPLVILSFVGCNTFFGWDFAMMLIPHWHSTVFPILFWFGSLFAGSAALIVLPALLGRYSESEIYFGHDQIRGLIPLITGD